MSNETQEKLDFLLSWNENGIDNENVREFIAGLKELDADYHTYFIEYFTDGITNSYLAVKWTDQNEQTRKISSSIEIDIAMVEAAKILIENLLENDYYRWGQGDE